MADDTESNHLGLLPEVLTKLLTNFSLYGEFSRGGDGFYSGEVIVTNLLDQPVNMVRCLLVIDAESRSIRLLTRD